MRKLNLVGVRYGLLQVIEAAGSVKKEHKWSCLCDCGKLIVARGGNLRSGNTQSCGCSRNGKSKTHGLASTPLYHVWRQMIQRCHNPNAVGFSNYGGRGIQVCSPWRKFSAFLEDMGMPPLGCTIERINVDGNYEPKNCRWATPTEQARNKRNNRLLTFNGKTMPLSAWGDELGINYRSLHTRLRNGWSVEQTLTVPIDTAKRNRLYGGL